MQLQYTAYRSVAQLYNNYAIHPLTQTLDEVIAEYNKGVILKAIDDGEIIGSVRAHADGDTVFIGKLMIHPDHQGKGLGRRLLFSIEAAIHSKRYELFAGSKIERTLCIYERAGYKRFREETGKVLPFVPVLPVAVLFLTLAPVLPVPPRITNFQRCTTIPLYARSSFYAFVKCGRHY